MATASDDFNRANGPLGANWATISGHGCQVVSNSVGAAWAFPEYECSHWTPTTFGADQFSEATAVTSGTFLAVAVRCSSASGGSFYAWYNNGTLQKVVGGASTTLSSGLPTWTLSDRVRLQIVGTTLQWFKNGASGGTLTDASLATGQPGLAIINAGDGGRMDDWIGGDVGSAPTLTSVAPASGTQGQTVAVTLTGTEFVTGAALGAAPTTVAVSGAGVTVSTLAVLSGTSMTAYFVIDPGAAVGARTVTVTTPFGTSGGQTFTVLLLVLTPTLATIAPAAGTPGTAVAVTLTGTQFVVAGTSVAVSGAGVTVSGVVVGDATILTALFTLDAAAATGPRNVTVTTAEGTSGPVTFTVLDVVPVPTLVSMSPATGTLGATVLVTLTGTNFIGLATAVTVSGVGVTVTSVAVSTATALGATFVIDASSAALGAHLVTVTTAYGTSGPVAFTVLTATTAAPTLLTIAPSTGIPGTSVAVTLTGTQFVVGATTILVSGTGVLATAIFVSGTTALSATLVLSPGAALGARTATVSTAYGTSGPVPFTVVSGTAAGAQPPPGVHNAHQARSAVCRSGVVGSSNTTRHLHIWLHGSHNVDVTCDLMDTTGLTITKQLSGGVSEFAFAIRNLVPVIATPVTVDLGLVPLWGGNVMLRHSTFLDDAVLVHHEISAVDWRWLLDRYRLVSGTFQSVGVNVLVAHILREFVDPASGFTTGDLAQGLGDLPLIEFSDVPVSEALTRITQATTATLYGAGAFWRIRPDKAVDVGVQWADAPLYLQHDGPLPTCYEDLTHERDGAQLRNEITILAGGAKVALPTFAGAVEIPVTNAQLYNPAGGVVRCSGIDITYAGVRPAGIDGVLYGCTGVTRDLAVGDEVQPFVTTVDTASQSLVATALGAGQSGRVVVSRENRQLSWSEAQGAATGELAQFAVPTLTFTYGLTTPGARLVDVGKLVVASLDLPGLAPETPADVIDGIYRVQEITITSITSPALLGPDPRLRVALSASPVRARSWYDLVKQEPDRKAR